MKGSPAEESGLLKGDHITHVDGLPMSDLQTQQLIERLRGPVESTVVITVVREAVERPLRFNLKRAHIVPETVTLNVDDGLAIIKISSFNQNTAASVAEALESLHAAPPRRQSTRAAKAFETELVTLLGSADRSR